MNKILIDSDVLLDFFFDRQPFSDYAAQVLGLCETRKIEGFLTPVIYSNLYYLLRQTARHEKVIEKLKQLLTITNVLTMDREIVSNALNSAFRDFEDGMQHFAAMKNGAVEIILTRNLKDYSKSEMAVMTPESFVKSHFTEK